MITSDIIHTKSINEFGVVISQKIVNIISKTIYKYNKCFMAVSGGSTPLPVYRTLIKKSLCNTLDWSKLHLFFIDERCVPIDDAKNNFNACHNAWLNHFPEIIHYRIKGWSDSKAAAMEYEKKIKSIFNLNNAVPRFDLIFMGIGEDGHIASLFPEYKFGNSRDQLVEKIYVKSKNMDRISMTIPLINNAKNRIIGIIGEKKRQIFWDLMKSNYKNYPVAQLLVSNSKDTWVIN